MAHFTLVNRDFDVVAKGSIAVGAAAVGVAKDHLAKAKGKHIEARFWVETDQVRVSPDATAAGATDALFNVGDTFDIAGRKTLENLTMIQVTTAATVRYWIMSDA